MVFDNYNRACPWDMPLQIVPAFNIFFISCFRKSGCLGAKGYGQAVTGAQSGPVVMCISIRSICSIPLSF